MTDRDIEEAVINAAINFQSARLYFQAMLDTEHFRAAQVRLMMTGLGKSALLVSFAIVGLSALISFLQQILQLMRLQGNLQIQIKNARRAETLKSGPIREAGL